VAGGGLKVNANAPNPAGPTLGEDRVHARVQANTRTRINDGLNAIGGQALRILGLNLRQIAEYVPDELAPEQPS
jgi:hypothetical protein